MYDILIKGGSVIDGTGKAAFQADIAVQNGAIAKIGALASESALRTIDAGGLMVAPGFIDSHAHSDTAFLKDSSGASKLYQGITTEITGQCGSSPFPLADQEETVEKLRWHARSFGAFVKRFEESKYAMAVNQAMLTGHGSLRAAVIGYDDRAATEQELERMKALLRRDLEEGAWGMSLGLEYSPGFFADGRELTELAKVVRGYDGLVPAHMRNEGLKVEEAIGELAAIGRESGAHVHISHLKIDNYRAHGGADKVWNRVERARSEGVNITADMYPFTASCTGLTIRCPKWSQEGGDRAVAERLKGDRRKEIVEGIRTHYFSAERAETCLISDDAGCWPQIVGKTLRYVAEEILHTQDYAEAAAEILVRTNGAATCIFFVMSEADMLYFLQKDVGIGSDGYALSGDPVIVGSRPHPRSYATMPEFFRLAREKALFSTEEAVRRVTSKPADMMGFADRGRLREGYAADITVFDGERIAPRATYLDPIQLAAGVEFVVVNGKLALANGVQTDERCGRFLKKR